jgi:DNA-binding beta-propeller fold protein YncE
MRSGLPIFLLVGVLAATHGLAAERSGPASRLFEGVGDFVLGARTDRMDYQSIDPAARRLYIAKMGAGQLLVFDLAQNKLVAQLGGFPKITGVLVVPELHKVYASVPGGGVMSSLFVGLGMAGLSSGHGAVAIRDTQTLKELARLPGGVFPDGIAYDPRQHRIFVSDELGAGLTVIDAEGNKPTARIESGGEAGNVRYDPATARIYVPDQSHNALVVIDPGRNSISARHPLAGGEHPHGLAISPKGGIGYVACDGNDRLLTVDLASGRVMNSLPVAHDPDVLAVDAAANRLYVASESGNLSTFNIAVPEAPVPLGDVFVAEEAHSVAVDPDSHRLYFALANLAGHAALRVLAPKAPAP